MNQLDATSAPINIFRDEPDMRPYKAALPDIALDNLMTPPARNREEAYWMRRTAEQDLTHADQADWQVLSQAVWFSVRGAGCPMPAAASLPAFEALNAGRDLRAARDDDESENRAELARPQRRRSSAGREESQYRLR